MYVCMYACMYVCMSIKGLRLSLYIVYVPFRHVTSQ